MYHLVMLLQFMAAERRVGIGWLHLSSLDVASGGASQMRRKILMNPRSERERRESEQEHGGRGEGRRVLNGVRACS